MKQYSLREVSEHNKEKDCWVVIDGKVFDVSKFLALHPGGRNILFSVVGTDCSQQFHQFHRDELLQKYQKLQIGYLSGYKVEESRIDKNWFGVPILYASPSWYQGLPSPYYNESHKKFRGAMHSFVLEQLRPFAEDWEEKGDVPHELTKKAKEAGWLPGCCGQKWPTKYAGDFIAGGVKPEEWDGFHELILHEELGHCGSGGVATFFTLGITVGIPPILQFGSEYLKEKVARSVLNGDAMIALCITEPTAGSDVANIKCEAKKTADDQFYIVNGTKKFITVGIYADFFLTAVRTGGKGHDGISFLLIEKTMPGVKIRRMKMSGAWASGTAFITFEDVKVPFENLVGKENQGFKYIMHNFNHERWYAAAGAIVAARGCFQESFRYANKRKTFGKKLIEQDVIRAKLGNMARQIESVHALLEHLTYQMKKMSHTEAMVKLGGQVALLKLQSTQVMEFCVKEAIQVFGGLGYTRGGQGGIVESTYRMSKLMTIGGGSEEILLDLGMRQASKMSKL